MNDDRKYLMLKRLIALIIGFPLFIIGLILIPLPGPGLLITMISLYIMSRGFPSLDSKYQNYKKRFQKLYSDLKAKQDEFLDKHDLN